MESTLINTAEDLAEIEGTLAHAAFMTQLAGTLWRLEKDDEAKAWRAVPDTSTVSRFGLTLADFPEATPPALPVYVAPLLPTYQQLRAPLYPPVGDALDAIVKGGQALEDWKAACMAVKALIPKTQSQP